MKKVGDFLALGNILVGIFIFIIASRETNILIMLTGMIGSVVLEISQIYYLGKKRGWF